MYGFTSIAGFSQIGADERTNYTGEHQFRTQYQNSFLSVITVSAWVQV